MSSPEPREGPLGRNAVSSASPARHAPGARNAALPPAQRSARRVSRGALAALATALAFAGLVSWLRAYPAWRDADARAAESGRLLARAAQFDALVRERDLVAREVEQRRALAERVLRDIPAESDQASVMRLLAAGQDPEVHSQTIVAGETVPATTGESGLRAVPLTVDMKASFGRVMEILARAEGARRLVRPIRIEIARPADDATRRPAGLPEGFVEARIELDAVYGVPVQKEAMP